MDAVAADPPQTGRLTGGGHRLPIRVYIEDTDAGGVVYHANYLRFMERARSDMLWLAGVDHIAALAAGGGRYVVAEARLRFRAPARLGESLAVVSRVVALRAASAVIQQRVMRGPDVLVDGEIVVAWVSAEGRPLRQPQVWREAFLALMNDDAGKPGNADKAGKADNGDERWTVV